MGYKVKIFSGSLTVCSSLFLTVIGALAQTPSNNSILTSNPVFQKNCAKCHGKTAQGRHFGGPSLLSGKAAAMSVDELSTMIKDGKSRMPKYGGKLTPDEIDSLVQQIKAASHK
jgi:cytochrome c5